jgi:putative ABC transport system permease protein
LDPAKTDIGLILPSQLVEGNYFSGENDMILSRTFSEKKQKKVGDTFKLGGTDFTIVGIVEPKLFTTAADAYLPLATLQKIAGRDGQINSLLLKATNAKNVAQAGESTAALFTDAKVTDAAETAKQVSGSLVSAANLTNRFIGLTTIIVIVACLAIVSLLTVSSVNKRVREIGTLKAIGWSNGLVVRQIVLENIVIGLLGAIVGVGLGLIGLYVVNRFNISLSATIAGTDVGKSIMRRFMGGETADITTSVQLKVMISWLVLSLGAGVALLGSVVAATFASLKASRMKPQEALRNIE